MDRFQVLQNIGLPSILSSVGRLLTHENYAKRVNAFAASQIAGQPSTSAESGPASGQTLYNRVDNLFFIMNEINHLFDVPPNFYKYTEVDETIEAIVKHQLPTQEVWKILTQMILSSQNL